MNVKLVWKTFQNFPSSLLEICASLFHCCTEYVASLLVLKMKRKERWIFITWNWLKINSSWFLATQSHFHTKTQPELFCYNLFPRPSLEPSLSCSENHWKFSVSRFPSTLCLFYLFTDFQQGGNNLVYCLSHIEWYSPTDSLWLLGLYNGLTQSSGFKYRQSN